MMNLERAALLVLPLAVLLAGVALLGVAPLAWGAGQHAGIPGWMPPFTALIFGLPAVLTGALSLRAIARIARGGLSVFKFQILSASLVWPLAIIVLVVLAARIPVPSTYDRFIEDSDFGRIRLNEQVQPFEVTARNVSPAFYMEVVIASAIVLGGYTAMAGLFYVGAIGSTAGKLPETREIEDDPVGEMLRGRRGPLAP